MTGFAAWLAEADAALARGLDAAGIDDLVERGLSLLATDDGHGGTVDPEALSRVLAALCDRLAEMGAEIDDLHRRRRHLDKSASGIATYIAGGGLGSTTVAVG